MLIEPHNRNWMFALELPASLPAGARYLEDGQILQTLFEYDEDLPGWQYAAFDLTPYAGRSISIQFGVYHDGNAVYDKRSVLYVDDVSLLSDEAPPP